MNIDINRFSRESLFGEPLNGKEFVAAGKTYTLAGKVGDGAIGVVRKAVENKTQKTVAIKFLAPEPRYIDQGSIDDICRRFRREGERGVGLNHDNLVEILAYEENENSDSFTLNDGSAPTNPFIIMEFVRGRTLEDYIKKDKSDLPRRTLRFTKETLHIAKEITSALVYLHRHSIVHRDVKPANIFLSKANPGTLPAVIKLGDFGVVKWGDFKASISTGTLTTVGQSGLGTLKYMASEQSLDPQSVDFKSDVYSLGITLFELFTDSLLHDIHHVIQIRDVRTEKRNVISRLHALGIPFTNDVQQHEHLMNLIFDCFLRKSGRPTSTKLFTAINASLRKYYSTL